MIKKNKIKYAVLDNKNQVSYHIQYFDDIDFIEILDDKYAIEKKIGKYAVHYLFGGIEYVWTVGGSNTYVDYNSKQYKGNDDLSKLYILVENNKIKRLLDKL